jgi:CRP-like cAMP-binding protein
MPQSATRRSIPIEDFLANLPLFRQLGKADRIRLAAGATEVAAPRGATLFRRGDACDGFHVVIFGQIKLALQTPEGNEKVIELMGPGQSFGEAVMFLERPYLVTAVALADSKLLHVSRQAVFEEIDRDPRFARRMIAGLSLRLHRLVSDLEAISLHSGMQRVIGYLLGQSNEGDAPQTRFTLPARKGVIASRLNLTHEHFSRILHQLAGRGLIEVDGLEILIRDTATLRVYGTR